MRLTRLVPSPRTIAVVAAISIGLAACGDDDGADTAAACDAFVAIDRAFNVDEDIEAGVAALADFVAAAPDDVADDVDPIIPLIEEDPGSALESEEAATAETAFDEYALENCGDERVDLKALDYAYANAPQELGAGRVVFNFTNESEAGEFHEALLLRKDDSAAEPANEILARALEGPISVESTIAALGEFRFDAVGFLEPEGRTTDVFAVDLEPGEYVVVCLLPVDSPDRIEAYFSGEELDGEQHFDNGMWAEFTVT